MFQSKKTVSKLVGALIVALTITSAANAQRGSFEGQYSGLGEAAGAVLSLAQSGPQVVGRLQVDGMTYNIEANVSGTRGYGMLGDPSSGSTLPFGMLLYGADVYVVLSQTASPSAKVYQFQRGSGAAASVDRRARRRERVKRVFAGAAIVAIAAAASNNDSGGGTSGGSSSGGGEVIYPDNDPNPTNDSFLPGGDSYEP
jgi:hypothetical protein